jgi:UDP-N-acetylmuramyl pentapeptide phosphotransferase/UDP-N-acetylglucosamine-1-phosphate transferase
VAGWIPALALSAGIVLLGVPRLRSRAFRAGWFERGSQTRRRRSQRRATHGGAVIAVAVATGAATGGFAEPGVRAVVAAAALALASGFRAEAGRGPRGIVVAGRLAVALVVPLVGVRAELTGSVAVDTVLTALGVLAVSTGLRSVERSDASVPLLGGIAAAPLLAIGVRVDDPITPVAAALLGATLAMVAHTWPPTVVRLGTIGPTVIGATLAVVAIRLDPGIPSPSAEAVPLLALAAIGAALLVPDLDLRLRRQRLSCHLLMPIVALPGAYACYRFADETLEIGTAAALALIPPALVVLIGLLTRRPRHRDHASHRARNVTLVGAGLVGLALVGLLAAGNLWRARADMERGREFATAGLEAARDGELAKAQELFETADAAFAAAADGLSHPSVRVGDVVPGLAQNLRYSRTLADVGGDLSGTAVAVAERAGADDLQVVDGQFPLEAARQVSAELQPALDTLEEATARLEAFESPYLVGEVRDGADSVGERIADATDSIEVAAEATRLAPGLLGADGDRRWMVAVVTPSEQRGAGGLAGDYAELRASEGDIDLVQTLPARTLNARTNREVQLEALPQIYRDRYEGFRVGRFWQNLTATPDVPTFGEAVAAAYPLTEGGGPVDGVIVIDPEGLAALLELTGPIDVYPWPIPLTADRLKKTLEFAQYDGLTEEQIDEFQSRVIERVVEELTTGPLPPIAEMAATLGPQVAAGHLRLWSPAAEPQALFERVGADGRLGTHERGTDFVQLVTQNDGENKIDWYLRRSLAYEASVDPATGSIAATATVTLRNRAPSSGVSSYVIGEEGGPTLPGENELEVTLYSPHRMFRVTDGNGAALPVALARERGLNAVTVFLEIPAGGTATVVVTYRGRLDPTDGDYTLTVGRQPAVRPDLVDVHVTGAGAWRPDRERDYEVVSDDGGPTVLATTFVR